MELNKMSDLELASVLSNELQNFNKAQQEMQARGQNISLVQQEINKRNQPKPKAEGKK